MQSCFYAISCLLALFTTSAILGQTSKPMLISDATSGTSRADPTASPAPSPAGKDGKQETQTVVHSVVQVNAEEQQTAPNRNLQEPFHATAAEIQSSAGTYGDFSRYLQLFPGVVFNSDESDDVLVRGGNPIENLYLLDGFEVPNINHIAIGATTGGLVSMIDTASIDKIDFQTGGYDASYEERLSSVITIHTRELQTRQPHTEMDFGFVGAGGLREIPIMGNGSLLLAAHRSLLNLFTNNIGLNGVPIYTNTLVRGQWGPTEADSIMLDSLGGVDSIDITPEARDGDETNTIDTQYHGWRVTNGVRWRHVYSPRAFGTFTLSDSEQEQNIQQQDQLFNNVIPPGSTIATIPLTPVYSELTHDGTTNARYDGYLVLRPNLTLLVGASTHLNRIAYDVAQPNGEQSPLSSDPARSDATSFTPHFWTGDTGSYAQITYAPNRWTLSLGGRIQTFAFGGNTTATPRLSAAYAISTHMAIHASLGEYAQLAPFLDLTSFPQNRFLKPIRDRQIIAGMDLYRWNHGDIGIEAYQKNYTDYPVSTEYPSLSLANIVDTLGQEFIWIPMTSRGKGLTRGVELFGQMHLGSRLFTQANVAFARSLFSGLDNVLRPGNFDYPFVLNAAGSYHLNQRYEIDGRYEYTSGRPYTPFLLQASAMQNRPIYDLDQINALRGPVYSRLDFQVGRTFFLGPHRLVVYGGAENTFDRQNLLGYAWLPRYGARGKCDRNPSDCVSAQYQLGRFPNFGARYFF